MRTQRLLITAFGALLLTMAQTAMAQTKVAYVDIERITSKAKPVSAMMTDIEQQVKSLQSEIETKMKKLRELKADAQSTEGILSKDEQDKKRKEVLRLQNELDELEGRARRKMREMDSTVFEPLMKRIMFVIEDVAKEKKVDIVLRGEAVIYGATAVDLSDEVIAKLNEGTGAAAPKAQAPKAPEEPTPAATPEQQPQAVATPEATPAPTATPEEASPTPKPASAEEKPAGGAPRIRTARPREGAQPQPTAPRGERPVDRQPER
ncbi:MAG: OmpH family outer membrane protein [Candidatus Sumerlaeaceae bacterium]|nr:OmpH family outer membrane protein [Candidatus Sumerlaeaceae bacterium]